MSWLTSDRLRIEVPLQILGRDPRLHAGCRHFHLREPENGVEDQLSEIVIAPVLVEMTAGETEPAAAVRAFVSPGDMLGLADRARGAFERVAAGRSAISMNVLALWVTIDRPRREARYVAELAAIREGLTTEAPRHRGDD